MRPVRLWLALLVLCVLVPAAAAQPVPADLGFVRGVYWPAEMMPFNAKQWGYGDDSQKMAERLLSDLVAKYHCNLVWVQNLKAEQAPMLLGAAQKAGVRLVIGPEQVYSTRMQRDPQRIRQMAEDAVKVFSSSPAFAGYALIDEPQRPDMYLIEQFRARLAELDPQHLTVSVTQTHTTDDASRRTNLSVFCSDIYPFYFDGDPFGPNPTPVSQRYYRYGVEHLVAAAQRRDRPAWVMPACFVEIRGPWRYSKDMTVLAMPDAFAHSRMGTPGEIRWQIWSALAGGVKGVLFFQIFPYAPTPDEPKTALAAPLLREQLDTGTASAMLFPDGTPTPQLLAIGEAFGKLEPHQAMLARLQPAPFQVASTEAPFFCASFFDPGSRKHFVVVCNDDTTREQDLPLKFLPNVTGVRDLLAGQDCPISHDALLPSPSVKLKLAPGDGTILQIDEQPGSAISLIWDENLSGRVLGEVSNLELKRWDAGWGWGQDHALVVPPRAEPSPGEGSITLDLTPELVGTDRSKATLFVYFEGLARPEGESLIVSCSRDGKTFEWVSVDACWRLVQIPADASAVQLLVRSGAELSAFRVGAVWTDAGK